LVGTSIDKGLPDPEDDPGQVKDLGLDPTVATAHDVFQAVCSQWSPRVRALFSQWLRTKAEEFLLDVSQSERQARVQHILDGVQAVPTSAKDWVRFKRGKEMRLCRTPDETGLPQLRRLINSLADHQITTTVGVLEQKIAALRQSVLAAIERSESTLGADIGGILAALDRSHQKMQEVQDRHVQVVEDLRLSVLDRFLQIRETVGDKIQNAALKMREVGRQQVQSHLDDLHWASLRATVNHQGLWTTRNGRQVILRDAIGGEMTRLVPQVWSRIADERLGTQIADAQNQTLSTLRKFTEAIRALVDAELSDELSRRTVSRLFEASLRKAEAKIEQSAKRVTDLLGQTSRGMQERVDEAVDLSLRGVCADCSADSGIGWKWRSVTRIVEGTAQVAEQAEARCVAIADDVFDRLAKSVVSFSKTAVDEMEQMGENIPSIFKDAVARARLTTPQAQKGILQDARVTAPAELTPTPA
jgi:hypothetical protein